MEQIENNSIPSYTQKSYKSKWLMPLTIVGLVILVSALASGITFALINNSNNTKASNSTATTANTTSISIQPTTFVPIQTTIIPSKTIQVTTITTSPTTPLNIKYRDDLYNSIYGGGQFKWITKNNIKTTFSCSDGKTSSANNIIYEMKDSSGSKDSFYWVVKSLDSRWVECDQGRGANSEYATFIKDGKLLNIVFSSSASLGTNTVVHFEY